MDRQKLLLILLAVVAVAIGGDWVYRTWVEEPFAKQEAEQTKLEKSLSDVQDRTVRAKTLVRDLPEFEDRSLPANPVIARQAYQAWWWQLIKRHEIASPTVDVSQPRPRSLTKSTKKDARPDMHELSVTVRGVAALPVVVDLLAEFHGTPFLHRIDSLSLTPLNQGRNLSFSLTVVALALRTATEENKLPGQSAGDVILVEAGASEATAGDVVDSTGGSAAAGIATTTPNPIVRPAVEDAGATDASPTVANGESSVSGSSAGGAAEAEVVANAAGGENGGEVGEVPSPAGAAAEQVAAVPMVERPWQDIVKRNMFAAGGGMTVAKSIKLSAITEDVKGVKQAWFRQVGAAATQIVDQGKSLSQGPLMAKVIELGEEHAILLIDGDRVRVQIGQVLADGMALVQSEPR